MGAINRNLIALVVSLLFYAGGNAQMVINFADSTTLNNTYWQGTIDKFKLSSKGLMLNDTSPKATYNQATLSLFYPNSKTLSWEGQVHFTFSPSQQNGFEHLLYPIGSTKSSKGEVYTTYIALTVRGERKTQLERVDVYYNKANGKYSLYNRKTLIQNVTHTSYGKANNKLCYYVSFDQEKRTWNLYADDYNPYTQRGLTLIGSYTDDYEYSYTDSQKLRSSFIITYSKKNAQNFTLEKLILRTVGTEPDPNAVTIPSIIDSINYQGKAIQLYCSTQPNISNATFKLVPTQPIKTVYCNSKVINIVFENALPKGEYELWVSKIEYPSGEYSPDERVVFSLTDDEDETPHNTQQKIPLISEIMPYPVVDGAEYIELYNVSDSPIDLKDFGIMLRTEGRLGKTIPITTESFLLDAKSFAVLTPWSEVLCEQFDSLKEDVVIEVPNFPSMPNNEGQLCIVELSTKRTVEKYAYSYKYFFDNKVVRGYSLERINYLQVANEKDNWQRSSTKVINKFGSTSYGTPGVANSVGLDKDDSNAKATSGTKRLQLSDIARKIIAAQSNKGSKARVTFFDMMGKRIATWHNQQAVSWAKMYTESITEQQSADVDTDLNATNVTQAHVAKIFPSESFFLAQPITQMVMLLELRKMAGEKPRNYVTVLGIVR